MQQSTKIAVMGGTGKSGKFLVNELIKRGYAFKMLLRNPGNLQINSPLIEVVQGDARNADDVQALLKDCGAVISMLGQSRGEPSIFSQATQNVLHAMEELGITRYIVTTGLNVDAPGDTKSEKAKQATQWMYANYPETTKDKQVEYEMLAASHVDWTMIRLPMIEQTEAQFGVHVNLHDCPGDKISAADLAVFAVDQLNDVRYVKQAPFIASK